MDMNSEVLHHEHDAADENRDHEHEHDHDEAAGPDQDEHGSDDDHHHGGDDNNGAGLSEDELAPLLETVDWADLSKRLIAYARYPLARVISARKAGNDPQDYAQRAIELLLEGTRRYRASESGSLFKFLCSVIDSLVSHDAEKVLRQVKNAGTEVSIGSSDNEDASTNQVSEEQLGEASFEPELVAFERFEKFAGDLKPRLAAYTRLRVKECHSTAEEYARALGLTVKDIRNMDRQLTRKRKDYEACGQCQMAPARKFNATKLRAVGA
jgi:hypothetical protein